MPRARFLVLAVSFALLPSLLSAQAWTRITIKKAFVSHSTFEANRDFFSSPEFGWNIKSGGVLVMRGDLYGDLFAPADKAIELVFVEQDIAIDDVITPFAVVERQGMRELVSGEDRFTIEIAPFDPEARSGADARQPVELKGTMKDTVSFIDQDRTDTFQTMQKLVLVQPDFPSLQATAEGCKLVPEPSAKLILLECSRTAVVRVQSSAGSARTAYTIEGAANLDALLPALDIRSRAESYLRPAAFSLFESLGRKSAEDACTKQKNLPLCGYYLYRTGDRAARDSLRKGSREQIYMDALNQAEDESPEP